jgi:histidinol dehydrogenase
MEPMIKLFEDWQQAQKTVLRRRDWASEAAPESILTRIGDVFGRRLVPAQAVDTILSDVRRRADEALREWTARLDGVTLQQLEVTPDRWEAAFCSINPDLAVALQLAAARIRTFHSHQRLASWSTEELGGMVGQRVVPLQRVGIYVPGGSAPLPSSLLMSVIPAQVAGVSDIVVCTPPDRSCENYVSPAVLAAAHLARVSRLFLVGGAQAIGALAYGTESVPRVDKIVGAGGLFVTLAKRQLYGQVGLDGLYGPTETVIIADDSANSSWIAADLLAQAEHDVLATAILLTPSPSLAEAVQRELQEQAATLPRAHVLRASLHDQGGIVLTPDLETAVYLANEFAPEHLCLSVRNATEWQERIRNAGGVFVGEHSFEVLGDYLAGPSHIMPTSGTARFASPLSVLDFVKIINIVALDDQTARSLCAPAACLASAESLAAHAQAASKRGGGMV